MPYLIGVDTGGTFTDFALFDLDSQTLAIYKYPSTPQDPSDGVISGLKELLADNGVGSADVSAPDSRDHGRYERGRAGPAR